MSRTPVPGPDLVLRAADLGDAAVLTGLERAAGLAGMGHLLPAEDHPYPVEVELVLEAGSW